MKMYKTVASVTNEDVWRSNFRIKTRVINQEPIIIMKATWIHLVTERLSIIKKRVVAKIKDQKYGANITE